MGFNIQTMHCNPFLPFPWSLQIDEALGTHRNIFNLNIIQKQGFWTTHFWKYCLPHNLNKKKYKFLLFQTTVMIQERDILMLDNSTCKISHVENTLFWKLLCVMNHLFQSFICWLKNKEVFFNLKAKMERIQIICNWKMTPYHLHYF